MDNGVQYIWSDLRDELEKFITSKVKDTSLSDDILQDVFIKIHLNIHQLKDSSRLTAWVYQITRNMIADHFKRKKFPDHSRPANLAEEERDEDLYRSLSDCVNSKIAKLSPHSREAVLLAYFKNYSQKELADFLGISYSGAKNRVQRAREKLRQSILDCDNVESDSKGNLVNFNEKKV
ncbi:MAG: RNA polymerase sigma factor SigZ [Lewinellaceae bacterium]|nr:RNA polymerase sigma factor SigZ [Phaeodactylibacter sp.]MCB9037470.1 RNA polymerase sigma factor SigZ [Lewinellaceae bacterium]